jgi:hypothetical protein
VRTSRVSTNSPADEQPWTAISHRQTASWWADAAKIADRPMAAAYEDDKEDGEDEHDDGGGDE